VKREMNTKKPHYVSNKEFSLAVVEYVKKVNQAKENDQPIPIVPDYVAQCFLKIAEGLSHKSNFIRYTYREEMVMDAVENCLKAITNYNIDAATRTGSPNAFSYFTQICYYAFLRRLAKEKKQQDIKFKFIEQSIIEDLIQYDNNDGFDHNINQPFVEQLRERIDKVKSTDTQIKNFAKEKSKKGIELFMGGE
jgi:chorismate mutase